MTARPEYPRIIAQQFLCGITGVVGESIVHAQDHVFSVGNHDALLNFKGDGSDLQLLFGVLAYTDVAMRPASFELSRCGFQQYSVVFHWNLD